MRHKDQEPIEQQRDPTTFGMGSGVQTGTPPEKEAARDEDIMAEKISWMDHMVSTNVWKPTRQRAGACTATTSSQIEGEAMATSETEAAEETGGNTDEDGLEAYTDFPTVLREADYLARFGDAARA